MTRTLHIFNPDTDYALGDGSRFYTPPSSVTDLRRKMALFPATYASPGDIILILDGQNCCETERSQYAGAVRQKDMALCRPDGIMDMTFDRIQPWGWNSMLRRTLLDHSVPPRFLPTDDDIDRLRELSHRRTTIAFHRAFSDICGNGCPVPVEIFNEDDVVDFWHDNPGCWLKAPWSSSGRGIMHTDELEERHIRPWARGVIRKQGSLLAEIDRGRRLDFATEWWINENDAIYLGLSVFRTSSRGKYHGNIRDSQENLRRIIEPECRIPLEEIIETQRDVLRALVLKRYKGPAGIDMLVSSEGELNPCVEINLRMTMGIASLYAGQPQAELFRMEQFEMQTNRLI